MSDSPTAELGFVHPGVRDDALWVTMPADVLEYNESDETWIINDTEETNGLPEVLQHFEEIQLPRERVTHVAHEEP